MGLFGGFGKALGKSFGGGTGGLLGNIGQGLSLLGGGQEQDDQSHQMELIRQLLARRSGQVPQGQMPQQQFGRPARPWQSPNPFLRG